MLRSYLAGACVALAFQGALVVLPACDVSGAGEGEARVLSYPCETDLECEILEDQAQASGCFGTDSAEFEQACVNRVWAESQAMAGAQ